MSVSRGTTGACSTPAAATHLPPRLRALGGPKLAALVDRLEAFETDEWAASAILRVELLTPRVWDPCVGLGVLARAAAAAGYRVHASDIHDWGHPGAEIADFTGNLTVPPREFERHGYSVLMNPPFTHACTFVQRALERGARKVLCFQKYSWFESERRRAWFRERPPCRIWVCGSRASCWRFDIPPAKRAGSTTPTTHAWFVWERGHVAGPTLGAIWKD